MEKLLRWTARPAEIALGAFFVFAAILKIQNPNLFAVQIHEYQVLTNKALLGPAALFFITLEIGLGVAMLSGFRMRGIVLLIVEAVLLFFTALIAYAWTVHGLKDCGCMGEVRMGPGISIIKNIVMMVLAGWTWRGLRQVPAPVDAPTPPWRAKAVTVLMVSAMALLAVYLDLYRPKNAPAAAAQTNPAAAQGNTTPLLPASGIPATGGLFSSYVITGDSGEHYDLSQGTYLVALLSSTCEHCMATVPALNEFVLRQDILPPLVALCYEPEPASLDVFRMSTGAMFPLYSLGDDFLTFSQFIAQEPPRLSLVSNGVALQSWDGVMPSIEALLAALTPVDSPEKMPS